MHMRTLMSLIKEFPIPPQQGTFSYTCPLSFLCIPHVSELPFSIPLLPWHLQSQIGRSSTVSREINKAEVPVTAYQGAFWPLVKHGYIYKIDVLMMYLKFNQGCIHEN